MKRIHASMLVSIIAATLLVLLGDLLAPHARAEQTADMPNTPSATCDPDGVESSGALYRICLPPSFLWNRDLVIYAHGYVTASAPLTIPVESSQLADGLNLLGYGFASTSYSTNGLAVKQGLADMVELVSLARVAHPTINRVILVGFSEGGLMTTLADEQYPNLFSGGLAACGPIGDFRAQVNYFGDFRVVFDYFFPNLIPSSPISITQSLMDNWDMQFSTVISPAITNPANAISVTQLLRVSDAPIDSSAVTTSTLATIRDILWYDVFATNDARAKLGGQPFDNQSRVYSGSNDDAALNAGIQRFSADVSAINEMQAYYQTSGALTSPLVSIHTTLDPIVPYWHESLYRDKVSARGKLLRYDGISIARYGHCNFQLNELQSAFSLLVGRINNPPFMTYLPIVTR